MTTTAICVACGVQFAEATQPPAACPICEDPRQYVPAQGQKWTAPDELRRTHCNRLTAHGELTGIVTEPSFAIGQRALLVPHGDNNIMWDCVSLLDEETAESIERRGGLAGIAVSHPHFYAAMVDWAHRFDCPIHLHARDAEWIMRPDPAVQLWGGEELDLGHGVTLIRCGGHFPGSTVLHWRAGAGGRGALLTGDTILTVPDRRHVSFMRSYPNRVPLPGRDIQGIADALAPYPYETLHDALAVAELDDARAAVARSVTRYLDVERGV